MFLTGAGFYFGARFKRTTTAVVATFALALFAWVVLPGLADEIIWPRHEGSFALASPQHQVVVLAEGSCGRSNARRAFARLSYDWPAETFGATTWAMAIITVVYCFVGGAFMRQAAKRLRKNVF